MKHYLFVQQRLCTPDQTSRIFFIFSFDQCIQDMLSHVNSRRLVMFALSLPGYSFTFVKSILLLLEPNFNKTKI